MRDVCYTLKNPSEAYLSSLLSFGKATITEGPTQKEHEGRIYSTTTYQVKISVIQRICKVFCLIAFLAFTVVALFDSKTRKKLQIEWVEVFKGRFYLIVKRAQDPTSSTVANLSNTGLNHCTAI